MQQCDKKRTSSKTRYIITRDFFGASALKAPHKIQTYSSSHVLMQLVVEVQTN